MTDAGFSSALRWTGFVSAVVTALAPLVTIPLLVPARSGPFCLEDCVVYPYDDIARFYPGDYLWMYSATVAAMALVVLAASVIEASPASRRVFAIAGFGFAVVAASALGICYFTQIEVVQPSLIAGEGAGIALLTQFNEHGLFIALEDFGYLVMSFALAGLVTALAPKRLAARIARWTGWINLAVVLGSFLVISIWYGVGRSYYFEVLAIVANWIALVLAGGAMAAIFWRTPQG